MDRKALEKNPQTEIIKAVNSGSELVFVTYAILSTTEEYILLSLARILERYGKEEYLTPLYSSIKELISNGTKANAKKILYEEGIIQEDDNIEEIVKKVRTILNEESLLEFGIKSKLKKISTRTHLRVLNNQLEIDVVNNIPLHRWEKDRISKRIEQASQYDSIAEFYIENPDPAAEGMGLGLSMVVLLLKSISVDYKNFSITSGADNKTRARIIVPLK